MWPTDLVILLGAPLLCDQNYIRNFKVVTSPPFRTLPTICSLSVHATLMVLHIPM